MLARAGCGGRAFSASRPRAQGLPYQKEKEPAIIVMLSEAKHLFWARLQILRRSAPQNDKLLNCSQTPQQTGICNWRQRGKVERKRCSGRPWLTEINTGFSRASRSPALRRLADTRPAGFGTRTFAPPVDSVGQSFGNWCRHLRKNWKPAAARATLRIAKPPKTGAKQPQTNSDFPLILPRHYAASGLLNLHAPRWYKP